jgi:predicted esterase
MNNVLRTRLSELGALITISALTAVGGEPAKAPSAGHFYLSVTDRSPLSQLTEVCRRLDIDLQSKSLAPSLKATANHYDPAKENLEAFIPSGCQPNVPHGLLVWVGVGPLSPAWFDVFTRHKLIGLSANPVSGAVGFSRVRLPLDAVQTLRQNYTIDGNRIVVAGFSAGAGVAVQLVCGFPDVFRGGLFLLGGRFCLAHKGEGGRYEPTLELVSPKWTAPLEQVNRDLRLVLMRAQGDTLYSPQEDAAQYDSLLLDGFQNVTFIVIPGGHQPPDAFWFEQGVKALESPRVQVTTIQPVQPGPLGPAGKAQRLLATAQFILERKPSPQYDKTAQEKFRASSQDRARQYLRQILDEYPSTSAASKARQLLVSIPARTKTPDPAG